MNDRIISANGVSLEGADYGAAVRVLRDSGSTVLLVVKRRAGPMSPNCSINGQTGLNQSSRSPVTLQPATPSTQSIRLSLSRPSKKEDFGIVLGCKLYVREVTREGTGARTGDLVTRIAGVQAENMSLKEARKLMDSSKERLSLVVSRETTTDPNQPGSPLQQQQQQQVDGSKGQQQSAGGADYSGQGYSSQNLYVPPPTRLPSSSSEDKSNLAPRGRSRGPLMDVSLSQLDLPATPTQAHKEPPRPPPPRPEDYYSSRRQMYEDDPLIQRTKQPMYV